MEHVVILYSISVKYFDTLKHKVLYEKHTLWSFFI